MGATPGNTGEGAGKRRFAVALEYDGSAYRGSQYQENGPSIQAMLESAIQQLTGEQARAAFAGRTDAGVHALGQVAAFDSGTRLGPGEVMKGLNHFLPPDIAVWAALEVKQSFDPRREARNRAYRYRISNRPVRSPLERGRAWQIDRPLDVAAMQRAAKLLEGAHDFAAFAGPYEGLTKRTLRRCEVTRQGAIVSLEMEAEAFLPHQVRRTAGPLVEVGLGRMSAESLRALLAEAKPSSAGPAAPAEGLYLVRVDYEGVAFTPTTDGCEG